MQCCIGTVQLYSRTSLHHGSVFWPEMQQTCRVMCVASLSAVMS